MSPCTPWGNACSPFSPPQVDVHHQVPPPRFIPVEMGIAGATVSWRQCSCVPGASCKLLAGLACSWMMLRDGSQRSACCDLEGLQPTLKSQGSTWLHPSRGHPAACQALGLCSTGSSHCQLGGTWHGASPASTGGERGLQLSNAMHCSPSAYRSGCCLTHSKAITYRPQGQCCSK